MAGFKRSYYRKWKRGRKKGYPNVFGTKPKFMPARLKLEKSNMLDSKTFYFKSSGTINSLNNGTYAYIWQTQVPNPISPVVVPNAFPNVADYLAVSSAYCEYRVEAIKVTIFASNVGTEVGEITLGQNIPGFNRGATIMFCDQKITNGTSYSDEIIDLINKSSAKMIPSRASKYSYTLFRAKGYPEWGNCNLNTPEGVREPDPWWGGIICKGQYAREAVRPLWFWQTTYKVSFRGRNQDT